MHRSQNWLKQECWQKPVRPARSVQIQLWRSISFWKQQPPVGLSAAKQRHRDSSLISTWPHVRLNKANQSPERTRWTPDWGQIQGLIHQTQIERVCKNRLTHLTVHSYRNAHAHTWTYVCAQSNQPYTCLTHTHTHTHTDSTHVNTEDK